MPTVPTRLAIGVLAIFAAAMSVAFTSAVFTTSTLSSTQIAQTDAIENFLNIVPGSAVQIDTGNPVATGSNASLAIDLGRVPDSHIFNDAVRLVNVDVWPHTVTVADLGLSSVLAIEFSDGTTTKTMPPGTTQQLRIRTTAAFAGSEAGDFRLEDSVDSFFFSRNLPFVTTQAPEPVTNLTAVTTTTPSAQVALDWNASTSSGVAGYNVYRATSPAGPYTELTAGPIAATSYVDTTVSASGSYFYRVTAVASAVTPELESVPTSVAAQLIPSPAAVSVPVGAQNPVNYVNSTTAANATVRVVLPAAAIAGDIMNLEVTSGATTVLATRVATGGSETIDVTGLNLASFSEGAVSLRTWISRAGDDGIALTGAAVKDTLAQVTGARVALSALNPVNFINIATGLAPGTAIGAIDLPASSMTTDNVSFRLTRGAFTVSGSRPGSSGASTVNVTGLSTAGWTDGAVVVEARVTDDAGNDSGWVAGTTATRDTIAPTAPTSARIEASAVNPVDYVNIATAAAASVRVGSAAIAADTVEARFTSGAASMSGFTTGGASVIATINASTLADTALGGLVISARVTDAAGNQSAWFTGTAGTKDTIAPNALNFGLIDFQDLKPKPDRVKTNSGSAGALDQLRVFDYVDNSFYPAAWLVADVAGSFGMFDVGIGGVPRTLGYEVRDTAWNTRPRVCMQYVTKNAPGVAIACP